MTKQLIYIHETIRDLIDKYPVKSTRVSHCEMVNCPNVLGFMDDCDCVCDGFAVQS